MYRYTPGLKFVIQVQKMSANCDCKTKMKTYAKGEHDYKIRYVLASMCSCLLCYTEKNWGNFDAVRQGFVQNLFHAAFEGFFSKAYYKSKM